MSPKNDRYLPVQAYNNEHPENHVPSFVMCSNLNSVLDGDAVLHADFELHHEMKRAVHIMRFSGRVYKYRDVTFPRPFEPEYDGLSKVSIGELHWGLDKLWEWPLTTPIT
ncbi:hypothetical protein F5B20DRAFT_540266 [Whalleya microplaca]|nr:hypothetical protein F5B20DRAFT_540266 [Whalleya microplaca]